jgi:hypothetical protein
MNKIEETEEDIIAKTVFFKSCFKNIRITGKRREAK